LHGIIEHGEQAEPVHLLCIHFDFIAFERERQIHALNKHIFEQIPKNEAIIIAGDFNDWRGRANRHLADDLHLKEVFKQLQGRHAKTYPAWMPMLPLDRIYYRNMEPVECSRFRHTPWHKLSDHAPLYAGLNTIPRVA
jgi:endonuclease/exonuclease/phosphatase family metal-dependent hydrolase